MNESMNRTGTTSGTTRATGNSPLVDSDHVEGTEVFDPSAKHIGTIRRMVIDKVSGKVVYCVASFGGFLGLGGTEYTIPWNKLTYDTSMGGFRTDITESQLKGSPAFAQSGDWDYADRTHEEALNDYYGSPYYWR